MLLRHVLWLSIKIIVKAPHDIEKTALELKTSVKQALASDCRIVCIILGWGHTSV
jgi:hypothetical protein